MANPIINLAFSIELTQSIYEGKRYQIILPLEEKGGVRAKGVRVINLLSHRA